MATKESILITFIRNIHQKTLIRENEDQLKDLEKGVKEIIQEIIKEFYSNGEFVFDEMIHVGSSYEGSKIIAPNEYDFMLILKGQSEPGKLRICEGCQPGIKLLRYTNFKKNESSGPNLVFNNVLGIELNSIMINSEDKRQRQKAIKVLTSLGELRIKDIFRYTLLLECANDKTQFDISVDLMPSVRVAHTSREVEKDMGLCPAEIKDMAFKDGCFLVGKFCVVDGMCWQLSFAAAERNLMRTLSPGHMKIYRVMKYLFVEKSLLGICDLISSYVLKTTVLRHAYIDCYEGNMTCCFLEILRSLAKSIGSAFMKSLFVPSLNLWQRVIIDQIRNITENDTICDKAVRDQLASIISNEGNDFEDALTVAVIFEFWKRVFLLIVDIFESADQGTLTSCLFKECLTILYTKLNEEDDEDDLDRDYFKIENCIGKESSEEDSWKIYRSIKTLASTNLEKENRLSGSKETESEVVEESKHSKFEIEDTNEEEMDGEDEVHDLEDIESYVRANIEDADDSSDSDEYSDSEIDVPDTNKTLWEEWFVKTDQEDVYYLHDKYEAEISEVDIPVYTDLLTQISKCAPDLASVRHKIKAGKNRNK